MHPVKLILFLYLSCITTVISAIDTLRVNNITAYNGLSQNTVRCMIEDSRGFIWLGTVNGLNRYNGKEFMVVNPETENNPAQDNRIRSLTEDKNGFIWVRTFSNTMFCYNPQLEKFIDYDPTNPKKQFSDILISSNGDVWLWGTSGCSRVRYTNNVYSSLTPEPNNISDNPVSFIFEDSKSRIWIGQEDELLMIINDSITSVRKGTKFLNAHEYDHHLFFIADYHVSVFDDNKQSFVQDVLSASPQSPYKRSRLLDKGIIMVATNENVYALDAKDLLITPANHFFQDKKISNANFLNDNKGNIWIYNMSGTIWRHRPDNYFEPVNLIPPDIISLINSERYQVYHDSRDIIWITTFGNGLFALDQNDGKTYHYTTEKEFATNYLLCVMEDKSGEMWVGTELAGVSKISVTNYPFDVFYPKPKGNRDRDNAVRLIYEDSDGRFWFGTRDGYIHVCDSSLKQSYEHKITGGLPFAMTEDTLGQKWVGTKGGGLLIFPENGNFLPQTYYLHDNDNQTSSSNNIFSILRDSKNRIWIPSFGGGLHLAERHRGKLSFRQINLQNTHLDMMRSIIQDYTGLIWIGTNEGIVVFDPDSILDNEKNYINLHPDKKNQQSLNNNEVRVVFEDSRHRIWLGTTGGGLNLLIREKPLEKSGFKHYDSGNGLSNEMIQAIQEDNKGYIWVSTESGISKFDPQTERFENFIFPNNRHVAIFNELSSWKKINGELMFGSYNGVYTFDPEKISYDSYAPPVLITSLFINGNIIHPGEKKSPLTKSITTTKKITLEHDRNSFNLECTMLNFHAPELNQYTYYLEGYEKDWNAISRNSMATYRNVPPGSYHFKVKASNSFGVWNEEETILHILILPPWWKSAWALCIYILLAGIITYFSWRLILKMHKLNMAVEIEKQLTEYKLRFFTNISHEFRTPLTIIRGSIENLSNQENVSPAVSKQLNVLTKSSSRLLRLIDQLLEFRRLQNDKMELKLESTNPKNFFYDIYLTFKEISENKQIEFLFISDDCDAVLLDRSKMDKIAYNLLSNAFKNTPDGGSITMKLSHSANDDTFMLSVSDSGTGVSPEQRDLLFVRFQQINYTSDGTGIGLHLTSELVKVHKGKIAYTDSEPGGACFTVSVPLSEKNYDPEDIVNSQPASVSALANNIVPDEKMEIDIHEISTDKTLKEYKVMVVEDDDEVREFIKNQLNACFTVTSVSNGSEAMHIIADEQPDIVVCDVMMPKMDGFEFTKRMKGNFETSHIPIILLTAYSSDEHQLEGIRSGADAYIAKPFSVKYLFTRIVKLIELREKLRRKFNTEPGLIQSSIGFTDRDQVFMENIHALIEKNISNTAFKIETFAQTLGMGRTTFFRKIKGLTGYPPNEYLRIVRLKKAAELLMDTDLNVAEISYQVGISDPFYLSKRFKAQFGKSPSQYRKKD